MRGRDGAKEVPVTRLSEGGSAVEYWVSTSMLSECGRQRVNEWVSHS